jgi:enoyl-CoA hydratase/carnithine racemase
MVSSVAHELQLADDGRVAEIVLRAPRENSLDRAAIEELQQMLEGIASSARVRAVIISGADGNFCSGRVRDPVLLTEEEIATDLRPILQLNHLLDTFPIPVIAAVEGVAFGFGFGLAALCDVAIVAEDATFALTELAHGIPPLIVLSYLFRFLPYKVAFDLALTGRHVGAIGAQHLGLATEIRPAGVCLARAREIAEHIASLDARAVLLLRTFSRQNAALLNETAAGEGAGRIAALLASQHEPTSS